MAGNASVPSLRGSPKGDLGMMPTVARRIGAAATAATSVLALMGVSARAQEEAPPVAQYQGAGDAGGFWNVVPPGQDGSLNASEALAAQGGTLPPYVADQAVLYDGLLDAAGLPSGRPGAGVVDAPAPEGITDGDLLRYFKDASFGIEGSELVVEEPTDGLVIVRDSAYGVPHIYGETREATMFGAGYAGAQDRLFLMDVLRHLGRARLSEFLGASEANRAMDHEQLLVAPYKESELTQQVQDLCERYGEDGARVCSDGNAYIEGVNAYIAEARSNPALLPAEYPALQIMLEDFIVEDIVAIASLVGGIFGRGGGGEVANGVFLSQLQAQHGEEEGRRIWADFRAAEDPEAPTTTPRRFDYNQHDPRQLDPDAIALLDLETAEETMAQLAPRPLVADGPFGPIDLRTPSGMSNAILASSDVADGGLPIAVFGPQTGYFAPQLLVEQDIHGPGIDARGVSFAGTNLYVQLGRGRGYAWSATSAGGDNVDQWVLQLCNADGSPPTADSQAYVHDGECTPMDVYTHSQTTKPSAGGLPDLPPGPETIRFDIEVERTVYGPVVARGTVDGAPVAVAVQRSTYGSELASAIGFQRINDPDFMARGVEAFNEAFDGVDYTFNWFYVDGENIAYKHSCKCPVRDPNTDPDLPTWGTGEWDWTGEFLRPEQQPQDVDPDSGFFANWNNKQAPGFRANDAEHSYSSTYRSEFLRQRMAAHIATGRRLTRGDIVNIAEDAATVDLNGSEIYPLVLRVLGDGFASDDGRVTEMVARLRDWVASGGHRRDADGDGLYDHAVAVAIGDALLQPLLDAVIGDELGEAEWPQRVEDHPRQGVGSAFNGGQANFLHKDLRQVLGDPVAGARSRTYCGTLDACRNAIAGAFVAAADALEAAFGSADVASWVYDDAQDEIVQSAVGIATLPNLRWQNRPTFQQVAQPGARTGRIGGLTRIRTATAVSRHAFPDGAETVLVAAAASFPDALAGVPLAAKLRAPLLLSDAAALSPEVVREVARLGATSAIVLGGTAALSEQVEADLRGLGLDTVERVRGDDRYGTAAAIAERVEGSRAIVASGESFPDALAAGPLAAAEGAAILLTPTAGLAPATATALEGRTEVVVAGGAVAVSDAVVAAIEAAGATVERVAGRDRYETARLLTERALLVRGSAATTYVVTGQDFPDALGAGVAAAVTESVLVLVPPGRLAHAPAAANIVGTLAGSIERLWLVGGVSALTSELRADLESVLDGAISANGTAIGEAILIERSPTS